VHYLLLILALLSSLTIAMLLRVFENKEYSRTVVIASNYITAGTLGYLLSDTNKTGLTEPVLLFGIVSGLFFFIGFTAFCSFRLFVVQGRVKSKKDGSDLIRHYCGFCFNHLSCE
jgi:hypothetical protein